MLQESSELNKELLIDDVLNLEIFSKRQQATQFVNMINVNVDGNLSEKDFSIALSYVNDPEEISKLKKFAHGAILSDKKYQRKIKQQNKLADAARRRRLLESNSNHVALKQSKNDSKFSVVRQPLKGGGVMYQCTGPSSMNVNHTHTTVVGESHDLEKDKKTGVVNDDQCPETNTPNKTPNKTSILTMLNASSNDHFPSLEVDTLPSDLPIDESSISILETLTEKSLNTLGDILKPLEPVSTPSSKSPAPKKLFKSKTVSDLCIKTNDLSPKASSSPQSTPKLITIRQCSSSGDDSKFSPHSNRSCQYSPKGTPQLSPTGSFSRVSPKNSFFSKRKLSKHESI